MPDNFHIYDSGSEFARNAKTIPQLLESAKFFRELSEHYRNMALCDELTGLPNRHATAAYIDGILSTVHQHGRHFGIADGFMIIACDIDKFKSINDTMGHDAGDAALTEFARRLGGSVRSKADPENNQHRRKYDGYGIESDLVSRHGGEEFLLILPIPRKDNMNIYEVACRIQERVCGVYDLGEGRAWPMSMSMGIDFISWYELEKFISEFGNGSLTSKSTQMHKFLFDGADGASYDAKNTGRARTCLWHKTTRKMDTIYVYPGPVSESVLESRKAEGLSDTKQAR